jgi:hypothetical protein
MLSRCFVFFAVCLHGQTGVFDSHGDIGIVLTPGTVEFDAARGSYAVTGSGENMWGAADAAHFVWKKVDGGDIALAAEIAFANVGGNAHRKGVLMIRQSLDAGSAYCDAALHGDGLTSLQCRERAGGPTFEIQQAIRGASALRIEKRGSVFTVSAGMPGQAMRFTGGAVPVAMESTFYVGIGVCAHDKNAVEKVVFRNVSISAPEAAVTPASTLEVAPVRGDRRAIHVAEGRIEAPFWSQDGKTIQFAAGGKTWMVPATGSAGEPSEAKAWAPAGSPRLFTAKRRGHMHIYSQPSGGGAKTWITRGSWNDGNAHLSSDGVSILFDSDRSGSRQVWQMAVDGTRLKQLTFEGHNWMPHLSPDGTRVAMLSTGQASEQRVRVRVLTVADGKIATLADIQGGAGSMTAPPWSPDSRSLTFVSYR